MDSARIYGPHVFGHPGRQRPHFPFELDLSGLCGVLMDLGFPRHSGRGAGRRLLFHDFVDRLERDWCRRIHRSTLCQPIELFELLELLLYQVVFLRIVFARLALSLDDVLDGFTLGGQRGELLLDGRTEQGTPLQGVDDVLRLVGVVEKGVLFVGLPFSAQDDLSTGLGPTTVRGTRSVAFDSVGVLPFAILSFCFQVGLLSRGLIILWDVWVCRRRIRSCWVLPDLLIYSCFLWGTCRLGCLLIFFVSRLVGALSERPLQAWAPRDRATRNQHCGRWHDRRFTSSLRVLCQLSSDIVVGQLRLHGLPVGRRGLALHGRRGHLSKG